MLFRAKLLPVIVAWVIIITWYLIMTCLDCENMSDEIRYRLEKLEEITSENHTITKDLVRSVVILTENQKGIVEIKDEQKEIKKSLDIKLSNQQSQIHEIDKRVSTNAVKLALIVGIVSVALSLGARFVPSDLFDRAPVQSQAEKIQTQSTKIKSNHS